MITDNNSLALALVLVLPLMEYCRYVSTNNWERRVFLFIMICDVIAVLGTYSRGGLIALAVTAAMLIWRSQRRFLYAALIAIPVVLVLAILPQQWSNRMSTIQTFQSDRSFQGRIGAWKTALNISLARPLLGGDFELQRIQSYTNAIDRLAIQLLCGRFIVPIFKFLGITALLV